MNRLIRLPELWRTLSLLLIGCFTLAPTPCNLRIAEYPGSSLKQGREGTSDVFAVDHELIVPIDAGSGFSTGYRQHRPLTVLKEIDKASPGYFEALVGGRSLPEAILEFYRLDPATRHETKYYTITLINARIVGIKTMVPTSFLTENAAYGHMEEVRLVYDRIEWRWIPDSLHTEDTWRPSVAAHDAGDHPLSIGKSSLSPGSGSAPVGLSAQPETQPATGKE
jgi:type VI secretion system secreted protein Hcp